MKNPLWSSYTTLHHASTTEGVPKLDGFRQLAPVS